MAWHRNTYVAGMKFFYGVTLGRIDLLGNPASQTERLPRPERGGTQAPVRRHHQPQASHAAQDRLFGWAARQCRAQGLDIDSDRMTIRVERARDAKTATDLAALAADGAAGSHRPCMAVPGQPPTRTSTAYMIYVRAKWAGIKKTEESTR